MLVLVDHSAEVVVSMYGEALDRSVSSGWGRVATALRRRMSADVTDSAASSMSTDMPPDLGE
jgi:hypothetical protein